jgi:flagellar basal-body rod modification protein FlgD
MQVSIDSLYSSDGTVLSPASTTTRKTSGTVDKADFLSLLCTQLKNQDPLSPEDGAQMASQLAQFSTLEEIQGVKSAITDQTEVFKSAVSALQTSALSTTNASAVSLIGKTVRLKQTELDYSGTDASFNVHLGNNDSATVTLLNADGDVVRTFSASGKNSENSVRLTWDGLTDQGKQTASGTYTIKIENEDTDNSLYSYVDGKVNGVLFTSDEGPKVKIDGQEMSIGKILEVAEST